jgi:hypothetical protein
MRAQLPLSTFVAALLLSVGCGSGKSLTGSGGFGGDYDGFGGDTGGSPPTGVGGFGGFATGGSFGTGGNFGDGGDGGDIATGGTFGTGGNYQTGGSFGTGGVAGQIDASVDAVGGLACPALAELTSSPPPAPPQPGCPCTRRPGNGNSYLCPMGVGQKSYAYVGSDGGSLLLSGQQSVKSGVQFELTIPPGALDTLTLISVEETDLPPPSGLLDWSPIYLVEPRGLPLAKVAGLQIPWSSNVNQVPKTLAIYARDENGTCGWKPLIDSYTNAGFEQASLTQLGYLLVGVPSTIDPSTCSADAGASD